LKSLVAKIPTFLRSFNTRLVSHRPRPLPTYLPTYLLQRKKERKKEGRKEKRSFLVALLSLAIYSQKCNIQN
jgi:hypothetical protein